MEDLKVGKFEIGAYHNVALSDVHGRYYDGEFDPKEAEFTISSEGEKDCSIVEFKNINDNFNEFNVIQLAEKTTEQQVLDLVNSNKNWFDEILQYKIDNPDYNGCM